MIISKAASFPFPAQKGENNCSSQGLKGPISPSPGGSQAFPKHFRAPHPTSAGGALLDPGSSQLLLSPSQGARGCTPSSDRGQGCPCASALPVPATAAPCPAGDSQAEAQLQHKGDSVHWCIPLAKDTWMHEGGWSVHTQLVLKKWVLFLP